MQWAREGFDVGLFSEQRDAQLAFWQRAVGLAYDHLGKLGGGIQQHRHHLAGAVLKMNHARDPLPPAPPSGYRCLRIAVPGIAAAETLIDPDGNRVERIPTEDAAGWSYGMTMAVNAPERHARFLHETLGFKECGPGEFALGPARIWLHPAEEPIRRADDWRGRGFRYLTLQIRDARAALAHALRHGAGEGEALRDLGELVRFGFIRDPDGNWIELSERTTFTGRPLAP